MIGMTCKLPNLLTNISYIILYDIYICTEYVTDDNDIADIWTNGSKRLIWRVGESYITGTSDLSEMFIHNLFSILNVKLRYMYIYIYSNSHKDIENYSEQQPDTLNATNTF